MSISLVGPLIVLASPYISGGPVSVKSVKYIFSSIVELIQYSSPSRLHILNYYPLLFYSYWILLALLIYYAVSVPGTR